MININFYPLLIVLIIYLIMNIIYFFNIKMKKSIWLIFCFILLFMFLWISQIIVPDESFDLYRYYMEMDYIRILNGRNLFMFIFEKPYFIWRILFYLITKLSEENSMLLQFTVPVTMGVFFYILYDSNIKYKYNTRSIILSIFVFFSIINPIHLLSGIRSAFAASIFCLGFYLFKYKGKKFLAMLLILISIFIHPYILIYIIIYFMYKCIKNTILLSGILAFWSILSKPLAIICSLIPFLKIYSEKLNFELVGNFGVDYRIVFFEVLQTIIIIISLSFFINKRSKSEVNIVAKYLYYISIFIIGSLSMINIFIRSRFIYAYLLPIIMSALKGTGLSKNKIIIRHLMFIITNIIIIYYAYSFLMNFKLI